MGVCICSCVCGARERSNYDGLWIKCSNELCGKWQHAACFGFKVRAKQKAKQKQKASQKATKHMQHQLFHYAHIQGLHLPHYPLPITTAHSCDLLACASA